MNPNFFLLLFVFIATGYLIGDNRGALIGGIIICGFSIVIDFLDYIMNRQRRK
jgi:hypothetical protein